MSKNITLKDIAKRAGVSYQTVSKVIRNQIQVTAEVRARIEAAIAELDYRPNAAAQNLRTQSSHMIGYSWKLDDHYSPVLEQFQHSLVESAESYGYHILLFPQRSDRDLFTTYAELIRTKRVDGFIISSVEYNDPRVAALEHLNVPFVSFGRSRENEHTPFVDVDGQAGGKAAVQHLIEQGHQRIAVLGWPESSRVGTERLAGYWEAMREAALPIDPEWIIRGRGEIDYGYEAANKLLDLPPSRRPTAFVAILDTIAMGVMQAAEACGYIVGRDLAVVGFDDMAVAHYVKPRLTTLRQPIKAVGQAVMQILICLLKGETPAKHTILLPPELIIRESSGGYLRPQCD
ncbi:MAG: LacI family transcriptional regulator [Chloroflexi bacterium]|nr:LacI family transcriptional regulator [Chloroflexota bacterium]MCC6891650.1 LacI family DNA-binding transcriptional regulator [Anaerolineae bacterium]